MRITLRSRGTCFHSARPLAQGNLAFPCVSTRGKGPLQPCRASERDDNARASASASHFFDGLEKPVERESEWTVRGRERATGRLTAAVAAPLKPKAGLNGPPADVFEFSLRNTDPPTNSCRDELSRECALSISRSRHLLRRRRMPCRR